MSPMIPLTILASVVLSIGLIITIGGYCAFLVNGRQEESHRKEQTWSLIIVVAGLVLTYIGTHAFADILFG